MSDSVDTLLIPWATLRQVSRLRDYGPAPLDEPDAYPGVWPSGPVLVDGTSVDPLPVAWQSASTREARTPVLAYGPNACPAHLARRDLGGPPPVLVPTVLRNHLVVYANHVTRYGAVPATVARWPGATCEVFLLWLTAAQHRILDADEEGTHDRVMLPTDDGLVAAHRARTGFTTTGRRQPVRVAGIRCQGQALPIAMTQIEVRLHRRAMAG